MLPENTFHLYGGPALPSAHPKVDAILAAAQSNAEIDLANRARCDDIRSSTPIDSLLRAKTKREGRSAIGATLFDVANVPDFAPLVLNGSVPVSQLLRLRESRDAKEFRRLFHESFQSANIQDVTEAYYALLGRVDQLHSPAGKILRCLVWTAASTGTGLLAGGPAGAAIGAATAFAGTLVDSFLVSRIRLRGSPKLFLDSVRVAATDASSRT